MARRGRRPGDAGTTRAAIVSAARELFAERGYDRTTMRDVGARAGVDPALIHHYFGTKEGLLAASMALPFDAAVVLAGVADRPDDVGTEVVRRVVGLWEADEGNRERLIVLFRVGVSHERTAEVLRDVLGRTILAALEQVVAADRGPLRAALVGAQMGGLFLGRYVLGVPAMRDATPAELVAAVGPVVQHYLTGPLGAPSRRRSRASGATRRPPVGMLSP